MSLKVKGELEVVDSKGSSYRVGDDIVTTRQQGKAKMCEKKRKKSFRQFMLKRKDRIASVVKKVTKIFISRGRKRMTDVKESTKRDKWEKCDKFKETQFGRSMEMKSYSVVCGYGDNEEKPKHTVTQLRHVAQVTSNSEATLKSDVEVSSDISAVQGCDETSSFQNPLETDKSPQTVRTIGRKKPTDMNNLANILISPKCNKTTALVPCKRFSRSLHRGALSEFGRATSFKTNCEQVISNTLALRPSKSQSNLQQRDIQELSRLASNVARRSDIPVFNGCISELDSFMEVMDDSVKTVRHFQKHDRPVYECTGEQNGLHKIEVLDVVAPEVCNTTGSTENDTRQGSKENTDLNDDQTDTNSGSLEVPVESGLGGTKPQEKHPCGVESRTIYFELVNSSVENGVPNSGADNANDVTIPAHDNMDHHNIVADGKVSEESTGSDQNQIDNTRKPSYNKVTSIEKAEVKLSGAAPHFKNVAEVGQNTQTKEVKTSRAHFGDSCSSAAAKDVVDTKVDCLKSLKNGTGFPTKQSLGGGDTHFDDWEVHMAEDNAPEKCLNGVDVPANRDQAAQNVDRRGVWHQSDNGDNTKHQEYGSNPNSAIGTERQTQGGDGQIQQSNSGTALTSGGDGFGGEEINRNSGRKLPEDADEAAKDEDARKNCKTSLKEVKELEDQGDERGGTNIPDLSAEGVECYRKQINQQPVERTEAMKFGQKTNKSEEAKMASSACGNYGDELVGSDHVQDECGEGFKAIQTRQLQPRNDEEVSDSDPKELGNDILAHRKFATKLNGTKKQIKDITSEQSNSANGNLLQSEKRTRSIQIKEGAGNPTQKSNHNDAKPPVTTAMTQSTQNQSNINCSKAQNPFQDKGVKSATLSHGTSNFANSAYTQRQMTKSVGRGEQQQQEYSGQLTSNTSVNIKPLCAAATGNKPTIWQCSGQSNQPKQQQKKQGNQGGKAQESSSNGNNGGSSTSMSSGNTGSSGSGDDDENNNGKKRKNEPRDHYSAEDDEETERHQEVEKDEDTESSDDKISMPPIKNRPSFEDHLSLSQSEHPTNEGPPATRGARPKQKSGAWGNLGEKAAHAPSTGKNKNNNNTRSIKGTLGDTPFSPLKAAEQFGPSISTSSEAFLVFDKHRSRPPEISFSSLHETSPKAIESPGPRAEFNVTGAMTSLFSSETTLSAATGATSGEQDEADQIEMLSSAEQRPEAKGDAISKLFHSMASEEDAEAEASLRRCSETSNEVKQSTRKGPGPGTDDPIKLGERKILVNSAPETSLQQHGSGPENLQHENKSVGKPDEQSPQEVTSGPLSEIRSAVHEQGNDDEAQSWQASVAEHSADHAKTGQGLKEDGNQENIGSGPPPIALANYTDHVEENIGPPMEQSTGSTLHLQTDPGTESTRVNPNQAHSSLQTSLPMQETVRAAHSFHRALDETAARDENEGLNQHREAENHGGSPGSERDDGVNSKRTQGALSLANNTESADISYPRQESEGGATSSRTASNEFSVGDAGCLEQIAPRNSDSQTDTGQQWTRLYGTQSETSSQYGRHFNVREHSIKHSSPRQKQVCRECGGEEELGYGEFGFICEDCKRAEEKASTNISDETKRTKKVCACNSAGYWTRRRREELFHCGNCDRYFCMQLCSDTHQCNPKAFSSGHTSDEGSSL